MVKIEDCPGFETFGEDVRAAREALRLTIKVLEERFCDNPSQNKAEGQGAAEPCPSTIFNFQKPNHQAFLYRSGPF